MSENDKQADEAQQAALPPLTCELCAASYPADAPGRMVTVDSCDICPECAPELQAEWDAMSDEDKERFADG